jgi:hypothetical protein
MKKSEEGVQPASGAKTPLVELLLLSLGVMVAYVFIFELPYFISEYAQFYHWNRNLDWNGWLENYNPLRPGWYRPSAFILQYQIVAGLVGWHNIFAFKCVTVLVMLLLAHGVYFLSRYVTGDGRVAVLAGLASAIHPVMYMLGVDLFYFDAMYQIALVWALYWFFKSFEGRSRLRLGIVTVLFLFSLTCKEQAFVFPAMMAAAVLGDYFVSERKTTFFADRRPQLVVTALLLALAGVYALARAVVMGHSGGEYRSALDWSQIVPNALAGATWIFRLFPWSTPSWDGIPAEMWASPNAALFHRLWSELFTSHEMWHPASAFAGLFILAVFAAGSWRIFRRGSGRDRFLLFTLFAGIVVFSVLPVYSGGRPWHFAMPAIFVMVIFAWGLGALLRGFSTRRASALFAVVSCLFVLLSMKDFRLSREKRLAMNEINYSALSRPPRPAQTVPANARIFYVTGGDFWAYGNRYLFEWVYLRPDVKDMPLGSLTDLSRQDMAAIAEGRDLFFSYDSLGCDWKDQSAQIGARYRACASESLSIDFSSGGDARLSLGKGWSGQEREGIWTDGTEIEVILPPLSPRDRTLRLWIHGYTPEAHPVVRMDVLLDSERIGNVESRRGEDDSAPVVFSIPSGLFRPGRQVLRFLIADPARPCDVDNSTDTRSLGFYFKRIEILPAEGVPQ